MVERAEGEDGGRDEGGRVAGDGDGGSCGWRWGDMGGLGGPGGVCAYLMWKLCLRSALPTPCPPLLLSKYKLRMTLTPTFAGLKESP